MKPKGKTEMFCSSCADKRLDRGEKPRLLTDFQVPGSKHPEPLRLCRGCDGPTFERVEARTR